MALRRPHASVQEGFVTPADRRRFSRRQATQMAALKASHRVDLARAPPSSMPPNHSDLSSRIGFTTPTWNYNPSTRINEATFPAAFWLLTHGLWYDANLNQDPDGDGVTLLMAYALNLDPRIVAPGGLPVPVVAGDTLSLSFHATSPGVTYRVETSADLHGWTTTGVTQTPPGADQRSTATVNRDGPHRFLRLTVED